MRLAEERKKSVQEKTADLLTRFSGSMLFVYVHTVWFGLWIAVNVVWLGAKPFDPFPFSLLLSNVPGTCVSCSYLIPLPAFAL